VSSSRRYSAADQTSGWVEQLMLPQTRRKQVMHFAHRTLTGGHCRAQRTRARIKLHFTWPGVRKDVLNFVSHWSTRESELLKHRDSDSFCGCNMSCFYQVMDYITPMTDL